MGHLQTIESELRGLIAAGDTEALITWVKDRVLESYRNGQAAPRKEAAAGSRPFPKASARAAAPSNLPV